MKGIRPLIEGALEREPNFRERSKRYKGFTVLLLREYPSLSQVDFTQLTEFALDFYTMVRIWNKVTEEREDLRGSDYNDKKILAQQAERDLGYEAGYKRDVSRKTQQKITEEEVPF